MALTPNWNLRGRVAQCERIGKAAEWIEKITLKEDKFWNLKVLSEVVHFWKDEKAQMVLNSQDRIFFG